MKRVYEGMTILMKYIGNDEEPDMSIEHDNIYCSGPCPDDLETNDYERLTELGWSWDVRFDCWYKYV